MHVRPGQTSTSRHPNLREAPESGEGRRHVRFAGSRHRVVCARGARPASKRARRSRDFPARDGLEGLRHRQLVGGARAVGHLVRARHVVRAPPAALHRHRHVRRRADQHVLGRHADPPVAAGARSASSASPTSAPSSASSSRWASSPGAAARRHDADQRDKEWTFANQGLGDIQIHPEAALPERDPPRPRLRDHAVDHPRHRRQELVPRRGADDLPADGDPRHRARLPRPLPRRGQRRHAHPRHRAAIYVNNAGSFTTPPTYSGADITTGGSIEVKNEVLGGLGLSYGIVPQKFDLVAELYGNYGLDSHRTESPARPRENDEAVGRGDRRASSCTSRATRSSRSAAAKGRQRLRLGDAARVRRLHLRAVDRRPRRRRLQGRRRPVPGRSGGLRRLRGRGRLPRARQRQGRHPRRRRQVPERARDQERLPGRGRLPRLDDVRSRRRPHPRRRRQVPRRSGGLRQLRGRGRLPRSRQRQGRHQGRRGRVPERARGQGRLRGHRRLPRSRQRPRPHPRRERQVPERARDLQRRQGRRRLPRPGPGRRSTRARSSR